MKKLISLFITLFVASSVWAYDFKSNDGFYYNYVSHTEKTVAVTCYSSEHYSGNVTIPSSVTYNGIRYSVTSIGKEAFKGCSGLTSITIPNSVTSIGEKAFSGCSGLTSITIPNSVTSIGPWAFSSCSGLTSVTIPNSVTSIGGEFFYNCSNLTSVTIPNSVTSIGEKAFSGCSGLTSVTIPNSVTEIGSNAFSGCSGLTSITIPNSVTSIGGAVFRDCSGLTSVTIPNSVTEIGENAFSGVTNVVYSGSASGSPWGATNVGGAIDENYVYKDAEKKIISKYIGEGGDVVIPNSVTEIGSYAFSGCSGSTSITIPNSVTSIGEYAFSGCGGLTSITIPNSVTSIGGEFFYNCSNLTSVTIPNSVTSIGEKAFSGCSGLTSVTIPNSVTEIGSNAFSGCSGLTSITIPNSVTSIGGAVFRDCSGLTSVTIPNSVTEIGENAFSGVTNVVYSGSASGSPWGATNVGGAIDENYVYKDAEKKIISKYIGEGGDVVIPNSVTEIGSYAFSGCSGSTSITIPNSVTSIGEYAFSGCGGLTSITISNNVKTIKSYTFNNCSKLKEVIIGANCNTIAGNAFKGCTRLIDIICYAEDVPIASSSSFVNYNGYLYVPCEYLRYYKADNIFGTFANIECIQSDETVLQKDEVEIMPEISNALFSMPKNESANTYTLTISNNGVTFCTLTFNAQGQLANIDFSTSKSYELKSGVEAFQFTVTGLSAATKYGYSFKALSSNKAVLKEYAGTFTTKNEDGTGGSGQGSQGSSTAVSEVSNATAVTIVNGQILVNGEAPAFVVTVFGQKIANANLKAGVYFVVVDGETVGVSVR